MQLIPLLILAFASLSILANAASEWNWRANPFFDGRKPAVDDQNKPTTTAPTTPVAKEKQYDLTGTKPVRRIAYGVLEPYFAQTTEYHSEDAGLFVLNPKSVRAIQRMVAKDKLREFKIYVESENNKEKFMVRNYLFYFDTETKGALLYLELPKVSETKRYRIVVKRKSRIFGEFWYRTVASSRGITIDKDVSSSLLDQVSNNVSKWFYGFVKSGNQNQYVPM